jgi:tRNA threonylcarbamoyladenosine dehydratase
MDKQLSQHSRTRSLLGEAQHITVQQSHVAVIGIGGVGSHAAVALARTGIGSLTLIDPETVSITDINRQVWARHSTIGKDKTAVADAYLKGINPALRLICHTKPLTHTTINELLFPSVNAVIDAIDSVHDKVTIIHWCLSHNIPFITCVGTANRSDPTALRIASLEDIHGCPLARSLRKKLRQSACSTDIPTVYSIEPPRHPGVRGDLPSYQPVPGAAGFAAVSWVITQLCMK